jgi:hypothetical protein
MSDHRDYAIVALAGALLFCIGLLVGRGSLLPAAGAQDESSEQEGGGAVIPGIPSPIPVPDPFANRPTNPVAERLEGRTVAPTASDSDSNNRFVAVTMPILGGGSILCLIDTDSERVLMYEYLRKKGLRLIAARQIDYDLRLQGYQDVSQYTRDQLRKLYEKERAKAA